ncbi:MAG: TatD family hydrolase [Tannerellaceae bacterium]|nr:TatD family hydrolase [Tannerellaceae bacterium]
MIPYCNIHTHHFTPHEDNTLSIRNYLVGVDPKELLFADHLYSAGIHPWYIADPEKQYRELEQLVQEKNVLAVGEAGLDKLSAVPGNIQEQVFIKQAILAQEIHKPLLIHCVKSWELLLRIRKEVHPTVPWIIHGFRGNEILAGQLIQAGFLLSFGLHFNPQSLQVAWPDALFTETDDSEVSIKEVYTRIAVSLSLSLPEFSDRIYTNVTQAFSPGFEK